MKFEEEIKSTKFVSEVQKAQLNIMFTAGYIRNRFAQRLKDHDLTHEQFNCLRIIKGQHPNGVCVKDIAERMIDRNSNVSRIVDKLVVKKLVTREQSPHDRREMLIQLTKKSLTLLETVQKDFVKSNPHSAELTETEATILNTLLDKMRD